MIFSIPPVEHDAESLGADTVARATRTFLERGALLLEGLYPRELVQAAGEAFAKYAALPEAELKQRGLEVGHRRFMLGVRLEPPFSDPELCANGKLLSVLGPLLGGDIILNSFGAVIALPGSDAQHIHRDHATLFEHDRLDAMLPPHAITVVVPLRDLDLECGTTALWEGSHRSLDSASLMQRAYAGDLSGASFPTTKLGDCYLMDYRLVHGGTANRSSTPRTILYLVYSRSWFRDAGNFEQHAPLVIDRAELERLPADLRPLFRFAQYKP